MIAWFSANGPCCILIVAWGLLVAVAGAFVGRMRAQPRIWRDVLASRPGAPPEKARILLLTSGFILALRFLAGVLGGSNQSLKDATNLTTWFGSGGVMGTAGLLFLLNKQQFIAAPEWLRRIVQPASSVGPKEDE
jgi:hypothetical protein